MSTAYKAENCGSPATCRVCQQRHRSLLHQGPTSNPVSSAATIAGYDNPRGNTLLATAKVSLQGPTGQLQNMSRCNGFWISGIGGKIPTEIRSILKLSSCTSGLETLEEVFIIPTVSTNQPSVPTATDLNIHERLPLADPNFRQPGPIDITLGFDVYSRVISGKLIRLGPNKPLAQGTRLGYVITGFLNNET